MVVCMAETALSTALTGWMQKQHLNPTEVADLSGLSRRTVYNLLDGSRAEVKTLWKLASALATHPHTRVRDEIVYGEVFPDLLVAGGYPADIARIVRIDLEDELTHRLRDSERARQTLAFLDAYPTLPIAQREAFDRLVKVKTESQK